MTLDLRETLARIMAEHLIRKGMWELRDCKGKARVSWEWPQAN